MRNILVSLLIMLTTISMSAQQHKYDRAGVTILHTTYNDSFDDAAQSYYLGYNPDSRYDVNLIQTKTVKADWPRMTTGKSLTGETVYKTTLHNDDIARYLNRNNIGRQIIAGLFNRKTDGSMDLLTVHYRGQYNATDEEYKVSVSSKRGAEALKETGELLIDNSYIVVFDNQNIRYEKKEKDADYYYRGSTIGYIFKIEWTEEMLYRIWDCWIDENTPEGEKAARRAAFEALTIPVTFVSYHTSSENSVNTKVLAASKAPSVYGNKSESQLKKEALISLMGEGISQSFRSFESQNENLALKTSIYSVKPIRAKLGTKEGLKTDYTFYVYENVQTADGTIKAKRVGVIRATNKIADNSRITTGDFEPSVFYQYAGRKVEPGQDLTEKKKANVAFELGGEYFTSGIACAIGVELDGYASMHSNYFGGLRGSIGGNGYNAGLYVGWGYRMNNIQAFPLLGVYIDGLTGITKADDEKTPSAFYGQGAFKINVNIFYPVQLYVMGGYNFKISENEMYQIYKGSRNVYGVTASAGLRFCF